MENYDDSPKKMPVETLNNVNQQKAQQRRREVHQRIEELNEQRRLKRLLSDEWDD